MSDLDLNSVKAGKYELVCLRWDQPTSKPGEPFDFVRHRKGDTVDLTKEEARRLLLAGSVKTPGDDSEAEVPGQGQSVAPGSDQSPTPATPAELDIKANAPVVLAWVGEDKARAQQALDAETGEGGKNRSTLVEQLQKIAAV